MTVWHVGNISIGNIMTQTLLHYNYGHNNLE